MSSPTMRRACRRRLLGQRIAGPQPVSRASSASLTVASEPCTKPDPRHCLLHVEDGRNWHVACELAEPRAGRLRLQRPVDQLGKDGTVAKPGGKVAEARVVDPVGAAEVAAKDRPEFFLVGTS